MKLNTVLLNCFLLQIPILLYNGLFFKKMSLNLPSDENISSFLLKTENAFRFLIFLLPLCIPIHTAGTTYTTGLTLYVVGCVTYFLSWIPHLWVQRFNALRSKSIVILLGPFFTPLLFLMGIAFIGRSTLYALLSLLFIAVHTIHGFLLYKKI